MAKQPIDKLSIIIPTINESTNIPLLFADLKLYPHKLDINVVDGGSTDFTRINSELAGANLISLSEKNRGLQMRVGAQHAKEKWLLFLHADCRLDPSWGLKIHELIKQMSSKEYCWYFDFKLKGDELRLRILEKAVTFRSIFLQKPYGDQGLLIHKSLYDRVGGISPIPIMEDLDFIMRVTKITTAKRIGIPLITDGRKWAKISIIRRAIKNAKLRNKWKKGEDPKNIHVEYYSS